MKCGTTWLYGVLERHPSIYFSYEKEIHYFAHLHTAQIRLDDRTRLARLKQFVNRMEPEKANAAAVRHKLLWYGNYLANPIDDSWYANLFSFRGNQKYCADFSNLYCHLDAAGWNHVKSMARNVKVIYIMRDPIARLWSHIRFHLHFTGKLSVLKDWSARDYQDFARQPFLWRNGEYTQAVMRLQDHLTPAQLKISFYEDIHEDNLAWLRELEEFLDVPPFHFTKELLSRRVAESPPVKMPDYFPELFADYVEAERSGLAAMGLDPGSRWKEPAMAVESAGRSG